MCEKKHDQLLYNGRGGRGGPCFCFYSTVTPLHDANDYNDGCMHGTDLSFYSIVCLFQDIYSERASERKGEDEGGEFRTFVVFLSCAGYKRASYTAVARSARLCYSDGDVFVCKVARFRVSEFPSRERGTTVL